MADHRRPRGRAVLAVAAFPCLAALLALTPGCGRSEPALKHVIFFVGDGMSALSEVAASRYLSGRDDGLSWHALPIKAYVATWDVNVYNGKARRAGRPSYSRSSFTPLLGYDAKADGSKPPLDPEAVQRFPHGPATDSASAATALATGMKTDSGNISWLPGDPPAGALTTIAEELRDLRGTSIGIVSTVPFNHATPAAFVSHNTSRGSYYTGYRGYQGLGLADEIVLRTKPEVVIGGGHPLLDNPDFDPKKGYISMALYRALRDSDEYVFVERRLGEDAGRNLAEAATVAARQDRKLFGLFGGKGGNFETPRASDSPGAPRVMAATEENPSLAEATLAALDLLGRDPDGFFLVVEQGDIDWANHDNDFRTMVGCVADLDGAVRAALDFVDRPGDALDWTNTLLLVTADHATGALGLGAGATLGAGDLPQQVERLAHREGSDRGVGPNGASLKSPVYASPNVYPDDDVSYGTAGHTNELVNLAAKGSAARHFRRFRGTWYPGLIIDNTQVNAALREAFGLGPSGHRAGRGS